MQRFILRQNIERYEALLRRSREGSERRVLESLLAEARQDLRYHCSLWSWTCPHLGIADDIGESAEHLLDSIVQAHHADFASLQVWDSASGSLRLIGQRGFDRAVIERFAVVNEGEASICGAARRTNAPIDVDDIEASKEFEHLRDWTRRIGIRAIHATPVREAGGRLVGVVSTHFTRPHVFDHEDVAASERYARSLAALFSGLPLPAPASSPPAWEQPAPAGPAT